MSTHRVRTRNKYSGVALRLPTYEKLCHVQRALVERWGRCTMGEAVEYMVNYFPGLMAEGEELAERDKRRESRRARARRNRPARDRQPDQ